ncbi:murein hydrolase activator EnvC family protein [Pseudomonadota bacterium]
MESLKKTFGLILITALIATFFAEMSLIFAQGTPYVPDTLAADSLGEEEAPKLDEQTVKRLQFLQDIRDQINASKRDLYDISHNVKDADTRLADIQGQVLTLSEQLKNLNNQIKETTELIHNVLQQIAETENELLLIFDEIEVKKVAIDHQKAMLLDYLEALYEHESAVSDTITSNDEISIAKLLLSDDTVGEQLQKIKYYNILEATGHEIFEKLEYLIKELEEDQKLLEEKKETLSNLYIRLDTEKTNLNVQRKAKEQLLIQTKGEEHIYQELLNESKRQQELIHEEVQILQANLAFIQKKMAELGDDFDPDDYISMFRQVPISVYAYIQDTKYDASALVLRWPMSPNRGLSAFFRDPSYAKVFGVRHNAIDIPANQGTPVRAPADGVVYKVQDNGFGYSYLIVAHKGGYLTVYGHISKFKVEPGDKIFAGQIMALSGGTPGTKGAGLMTTGAHLHFEVMKGGKYVDPLDHLPVIFLPLDSLPSKYRAKYTGEKAKVARQAGLTSDEELRATSIADIIEMVEGGGDL